MTIQTKQNRVQFKYIILSTILFTIFIITSYYVNIRFLYANQIKDWMTNLIGFSTLPFIMAQGLIQVLGQYEGTYFWSLFREGILGQRKVRKYEFALSIIFDLIITVVILLNLNQKISVQQWIALISYSGISNAVFNLVVYWYTDHGITKQGINFAIMIQALIFLIQNLVHPYLSHILIILSGILILLVIFLILIQKQVIAVDVQNSTTDFQARNSRLKLPVNSSGIFVLLLSYFVYQFLLNYNQNLAWFGFIISIVLLNYFYSVIMLSPDLIAENLRERNSYLIYNQKIVMSGKSTENLLKKLIRKQAGRFNLILLVLAILGEGISCLTYNQVNGISLIVEMMLLVMLSYQLYWDVKKWIWLIR